MKRITKSKRSSFIAIIVATLMLMAVFAPGTLQAGTSTGIWTCYADPDDQQNVMEYNYWEDVYVRGANLATTSYFIKVTETNGDLISQSPTAVVKPNAEGAFGPDQLASYLPSFPFEAGVYKVWICPDDKFSESNSKTDNFKVNYSGTEDDFKAYLQVLKTSDGTALPANGFPYTITGDGVQESGTITATGTVLAATEVTPGETYTITEDVSGFDGWSNSFASQNEASFNLISGGIEVTIPDNLTEDVTVTVTIDNSFEEIPVYTANLSIEKATDPDDAVWPAGGFQVKLTGPSGPPQTLDITEANNPLELNDIAPGTYTLEELALPAGWSFVSFGITGAENVSDTAVNPATFTIPEPVESDVDVEVTINNSYEENVEPEATLTVIKEIEPEGTAILENKFLLQIFKATDYPDDELFGMLIDHEGTIINEMSISPGQQYYIIENVPAGWERSFSVEGIPGEGWFVDDDGNLQLSTPPGVDYDVDVVVTITNTKLEDEYGDLYIKKIVVGDGPDDPFYYDVSLCPVVSVLEIARPLTIDDGCIHLQVEEGINSFNNEDYELEGSYNVDEWGPVNSLHQGFLVFLSNSDWEYDPESPISGDGGDDFECPAEPTPVYINPSEDTYLVIINYFEKDTPDYPELIVKKRIGTGTSTQKYYDVELQKWVCPDRTDLDCSWETVKSFQIAVGEPWSALLYDLYLEYGYGEYRVIETGTSGISRWTSLSYALNGESVDEAIFWIYGEEQNDIVVEVTNNFRRPSSGGGDDWPRLTLEKVIGDGPATQDSFTVELQKEDDGDWDVVDTFTIEAGDRLYIDMEDYGAGTYKVVEITEGIENFESVSYEVTGDTTNNEYEFDVVKNGRNSKVVITNNFEEDEEEVIIKVPEPTEPVIVPTPAPALPETGAAPIAAGLGLILAAGGMAIRRMKK